MSAVSVSDFLVLDFSNPTGGIGTEEAPFPVADAADLARVGSGIDGWTLGKHYEMTADIDLSSIADWTPIGSNAAPFTGSFNGNGYKITNLTITGIDNYKGLFGYVDRGAIVRNVSVSGTVAGNCSVGGIAGRSSGTIENCCFAGSITAVGNYTGGITGYNGSGGIVQNCCNLGAISGAKYTGGIAGYNTAEVGNCYNIGTVNSDTTSAIGGIAGYNEGSVKNSVSLGAEVKYGSSTSNYSGRVVGVNSGILSNNFARSSMAGCFTTIDTTVRGRNGESISSAKWGRASWWRRSAGWDDVVWDFSGTGAKSYPRLRVFE